MVPHLNRESVATTMSKWMALLREQKNSSAPRPEPTEPTKGGSVGFVGSSPWEVEKIDVPNAEAWQHEAHVSDWVDRNERAAQAVRSAYSATEKDAMKAQNQGLN